MRHRSDIYIGIDFDNTIVTYDNVFHKYACELGLIVEEVKRNKQAIRDAIRMLPGGENTWIELQGLVYGCHMDESELVEGVELFLQTCKEKSTKVSIISHKTIYTARGPRYNLQEAAKRWIESKNFLATLGLHEDDIVFEETLNGKLTQIKNRRCTHFIDDLPEVLLHPGFPPGVEKMLYSQTADNEVSQKVLHFKDWNAIRKYFIDKIWI